MIGNEYSVHNIAFITNRAVRTYVQAGPITVLPDSLPLLRPYCIRVHTILADAHRQTPSHTPLVCSVRASNRLIEVSDEIGRVFEADGEAQQVVVHAGRQTVALRDLTVRDAGRVDDQRARIADVGHVGE